MAGPKCANPVPQMYKVQGGDPIPLHCRHEKSHHYPNPPGGRVRPEICMGAFAIDNRNVACECTRFVPREDASQAAARIVREATKDG